VQANDQTVKIRAASRRYELAFLGTLCLIVSSKPSLLDDPLNWEKDTVLASISGGTTRPGYVIPVTKDKVCVCYSCDFCDFVTFVFLCT
jgi:hypothetical protein